MSEQGLAATSGKGAGFIDELCRSAAELLGCEAAVCLYAVEGIKRVIGSHGIAARYRSYEFDFAQSQYNPEDRLLFTDLKPGGELSGIASRLGISPCRFFLREPVLVDGKLSASLLVFSSGEHQKPDRSQHSALAALVKLLRKEVTLRKARLSNPEAHVTVISTLAGMAAEVSAASEPQVLLDANLKVLAASQPLARLLGLKLKQIVGHRHDDIAVPAGEAIGWLYRHALQTRISPPQFEIVTENQSGERAVYRLAVSPFSPTDTKDYFLFVTVNDVTGHRAASARLAARIGSKAKPGKEPSMLFLLETLVPRRVIHERNTVGYLSLASWRQSIRSYQIEALKALKQNIPAELPAAIASGMAQEIESLVGATAFRAIVPMPCSHAGSGHCLSLEIARALGAATGLPVIQALAAAPQTGASHPKKNARRPPLRLVEVPPGPAILVDDVATSGAHVEEAVKLLKSAGGAVLAVVWISGDKA